MPHDIIKKMIVDVRGRRCAIERRHTDRFRALMDRFLPRWRQRRDELNRTLLAHEEWTYRRSAESPPNGDAASPDGVGTSGGPPDRA